MFRKIFLTIFLFCLVSASVAGLFLTWGYFYITRDLPKLSRIEDYKPPAVTRLLAKDGQLIAEFYSERRYPAKLSEVPLIVRNAFLAAEDASFYSHAGIDPVSILRAVYKNFESGNVSQGGSTITQQVVKNLLLSSERKYIRKLKEAILSYRLERRFTKDEILEIYLNQIFFGNTAYGIKSAARTYFHKELSELTVGEAAILGGLPKAPSYYSPLASMSRAKRRQRYVLKQMVTAGFITQKQADEGSKEAITVYPASQQNVFGAPYYVGEVRRLFAQRDDWKGLDLDSDGLEVTTAVDVQTDDLAGKALKQGLRAVDKRRGWRGPRGHGTETAYVSKHGSVLGAAPTEGVIYLAFVRSITRSVARVLVGNQTFNLDLSEAGWAKKFRSRDDSTRIINPAELVEAGDVIEVSFKPGDAKSGKDSKDKDADVPLRIALDQTPDIEGAIVLLNPSTGEVHSMAGGYDYGQSQFNRVTQSLRQPGSTFKPIVYLAAIDKYKYTPATIVQDIPRTFRVGDTFWTPANFDQKFLGPITLRTALEKSRNLVSADIVSRIGVDAPIHYAKLLGITSPLGRNLSLSLGSSEVSLLEMARAYGVLDAQGVLFDSVFVTKIKDRFGKVLYDHEQDRLVKAKQVVSEDSAFIMTNMLRGVVEHGTGYKAKELGRPVAGKTGTSNDQMDAWFIAYTPTWVCGVWAGFDQKKQIGPRETGGVVSAPIWVYFMRSFLEMQKTKTMDSLEREAREEAERLGIKYVPPAATEQLEFNVPDGVEPFWINKATGVRAEPGSPGAILEYFVKGTEPEKSAPPSGGEEASASSYLESPDL